MDGILIELIVLTLIIHLIDTLAYSVRLNSVKTGQFALSISLFNIFVLVSRTANTLQAPKIGSYIGQATATNIDPLSDIRMVILSATIGTLIGILLIPSFLKVFAKGVKRLEVTGSVPSLVVEALSISNVKQIVKNATRPSIAMLHKLRYKEIPKRLLIINTLITGIYTIGVLSAYYATLFVPEEKILAAAGSSGMINGIATILLTLLVDPKSAMITDQARNGSRPYGDVKALVILLIGSKLLGTLLGQLLFVPAAHFIASFYN